MDRYCIFFKKEAIARSFETEEAADAEQCYFKTIKQELRRKRDWLAEQLTEIGFEPLVPDGGYFMLVDISKLAHEHKFASDSKEYKDHKFVKYMIKKHVRNDTKFFWLIFQFIKLCHLRNWL